MINNFCDTVITIPQTIGTCWFNSLLMMIFYSQNSRKLLLHYNKFKGTNIDELNNIFKSMLYKSYIKNSKIYDYLLLKSPQYILSLLNFHKKTDTGENIYDNYGHHINNYIHIFLDRLEIEYLILDCFNLKTNRFYIGISEMMEYKLKKVNNEYKHMFYMFNFKDDYIKNIYLKISPDFKLNKNQIANTLSKLLILLTSEFIFVV